MKYIGMALVLFSCSGMGLLYSYLFKKRVDDLNEWKKGIVLMKSEINFALTPLSEAFEAVGKKLDGQIKFFFSEMAQLLKISTNKSLDKIDNQTIRKMFKDTCLFDKDINKLISFVKNLGLTDKESQLNQMELHIKNMEEDIISAKNDEQKNNKLFKTLGVLSGIFIIVIFI